MKTTVRKLAIIIPTALLAVTAVILRTVACLTELNYTTGLFADSAVARISGWTSAAITLLLLSLLLARSEISERRASFRGPLTYLPSGVLGAALVLSAIDLIGYVAGTLGGIFTGKLLTRWDCLTALLAALLAVCAAGHCVVSALIPTVRSNLRANLGMLAALCFACYTIHLFFRTDTSLSDPAKIADEMAFLSAALFMLSETRLSLGRARWKDYFVFGSISAVLCAYSSVPALITYFFNSEIISASIQQSLLLLALMIFSVLRLLGAVMLDKNRPSSFVAAINSDARGSEEDTPLPKEEEESEPPQLSIDDIEEPERQGEK